MTTDNPDHTPDDNTSTFRFNWQHEDHNGFLKWLLVTIIPPSQRPEIFERLSAATDKFTNVELTVQVNGIPMDAEKFVRGVESNMTHFAQQEARRILAEHGRLNELNDLLTQVDREAKQLVQRRLAEAGFELPDNDD